MEAIYAERMNPHLTRKIHIESATTGSGQKQGEADERRNN